MATLTWAAKGEGTTIGSKRRETSSEKKSTNKISPITGKFFPLA
jgi:hypothetical protein